MALLAKGEDAFWVNNQITATGKPAKVQARVGAAKGKAPAQLPSFADLEASALRVRQRQRLRQGHHRQPLEGRPEAPDRSSASRARATRSSPPGRGILDVLPRRGRQAHHVHRLLHRQSEGREAQLLRAPDRAGVAHGHDAGHPRARRSAAQGRAVRELRRAAGRRPALLPGVRRAPRAGARCPSATSSPPAARPPAARRPAPPAPAARTAPPARSGPRRSSRACSACCSRSASAC